MDRRLRNRWALHWDPDGAQERQMKMQRGVGEPRMSKPRLQTRSTPAWTPSGHTCLRHCRKGLESREVPGTRPLLELLPVALEAAGPARRQSWGQACPTDLAGGWPRPGAEERLRRGRRSCRRPLQPTLDRGPFLAVQRAGCPSRFSRLGSLSAMASAPGCVSQVQVARDLQSSARSCCCHSSFLMPAKVSCLWAAWWLPGARLPPWGTKPGPLGGDDARIPERARLPRGARTFWSSGCCGRCPARNSEGHGS